jgi:hypothetical protein
MSKTIIRKAGGLTRRHFLALIGTAVAASAGMVAWYRRQSGRVFGALRINEASTEQAALDEIEGKPLEQAIKDYYHYLKLDESGVRAFVTAHQSSSNAAETGERARADTMSRYLLSTDFFRHGSDESRIVRFVAYHDPVTAPCLNPFG